MKSVDAVLRNRAIASLENAALATGAVAKIAGEWAALLDSPGSKCPFVRLSPSLNGEESKQFGILRRVVANIAAARLHDDYPSCARHVVKAYETLIEAIRKMHDSHHELGLDEGEFSELQRSLAHMGSELQRQDSSMEDLNSAVEGFVAAFTTMSIVLRKREDEILRQRSQTARDEESGTETLLAEVARKVGSAATEQADRIVKSVNKGLGVTNSLIRRTWGEAGEPKDRRTPAERRRVTEVVEMYVRKHDMEGKTSCSWLWCCRQVLKDAKNGEYDESEVKSLHNAVTYDKKTYYNLSVVRASLESEGKT